MGRLQIDIFCAQRSSSGIKAALLAMILVSVLANPPKLSGEKCDSMNACAGDLICASLDYGGNLPAVCGAGKGFESYDCFCTPSSGLGKCPGTATIGTCPPGEACMMRSGSAATCLSCALLRNSSSLFLVNSSDTSCTVSASPWPTPTPTFSPVGGGIGELCTIDTSCTSSPSIDGVDCYESDGITLNPDFRVECFPLPPVRCECALERYSPPCASSADCRPNHVCALDTFGSERRCISCGAILQRIQFQLVDRSDSCEGATPAPIPQLLLGPNGQSDDSCSHPSACNTTAGLTCLQNNNEKCVRGVYCSCKPLRRVTQCATSSDCPVYEACIADMGRTSTDQINYPFCTSLGIIPASDSETSKVLGRDQIRYPTALPGITGQTCEYDWECKSPRRCQHIAERQFGRCAGRQNCVCNPIIPAVCLSDTDCDDGEICVNVVGARSKPFCTGEDFLSRDKLLFRVQSDGGGNDDEIVTDEPIEQGSKLAGEPCFTNVDCRSGATCKHVMEEFAACEGRRGCVCNDPSECHKNSDCAPGEMCYIKTDASLSILPTCLSESVVQASTWKYNLVEPEETSEATPTSDDNESEDDEVCIDADALLHVPVSELVYGRHGRRATVLCNSDGSCATPGHLVEWQGSNMLMRTYCARWAPNGCVRKVMRVNSPVMRWNKRIRVPSKTGGLHYSAFAARFGTNVEEILLRAIVRVGRF